MSACDESVDISPRDIGIDIFEIEIDTTNMLVWDRDRELYMHGLFDELHMDLITYLLSVALFYSSQVSENLTIEEHRLSVFLRESTRSEIEYCLATESMDPTRVSTFDIIRGDLESWNSSHSCSCADEDIGLVDTCRNMTIGTHHSCDSLSRDPCIISRECEEVERRSGIIATYLSDDLDIDMMEHDACSDEFTIFSDFYMSR